LSDEAIEQKLAAILAADVAGYSALMGDDERATVATLDAYRDVFRTHVAAENGRVVDTAGDSVLAVFPSTIGAVRAALAIQAVLKPRNEALPEHRRMHFRIGVNLGDVIEMTDGTVYGDGVNIAARLESLAEPGGLTISGTIFDQVDGKLDIGFESLGEKDVKNIARPVRAYRADLDTSGTQLQHPIGEAVRPSIAVLAFENLSGDPDQEYFADGIAEDLITELSRLRWLQVTARNSSFTYKGQAVDLRQVGRDLGVRYVVEGSVRKGGERVRITAQLIDTATGNHLWAERYDRDLSDIFALQDEITETLVATLQMELGEFERELAHRKPPGNLDAWDAYQRGMWHLWKIDAENMGEAEKFLRRATESDPKFSQAFAFLAFALFLKVAFVYTSDQQGTVALALSIAKRAIALDDKEAMGHYSLGRLQTATGEFDLAEASLDMAIKLNPSSALAHYGLGFARAHRARMLGGEAEPAIGEYDIALRLSPRDPAAWAFYGARGAAHFLQGNFEATISDSNRALQFPAAHAWPYMWKAGALAQLGRREEAQAALDEMSTLNPDYGLPELMVALSPLDPEAARPWLRTWINGLHIAKVNIPGEPTTPN
jgi:TolB-like protein/Tfp pilus assembly protein PilF